MPAKYPAALADVRTSPQLNLMHAEYFAGIGKYDFASLALPLKDSKRTLGLTLLRFAVDDIPNTVFLVQPDGSIDFSNITTFSSADYAFLISLAQQVDWIKNRKMNFGINAKIIHRQAGDFTTSWGFGFDAAVQVIGERWKLGIVAKDVTTTFNAWSYNISQEWREVFYATSNDIPSNSIELTAPQLIPGFSYNFPINKKINLLAEADFYITFDGKRNTVVSSNPISIDPRVGLELSYNHAFLCGVVSTIFSRHWTTGIRRTRKKYGFISPPSGPDLKSEMWRLTTPLQTWRISQTLYIQMYFH